MQVLTYNDRPDYAAAYATLNNAIPIYYDSEHIKEEYEVAEAKAEKLADKMLQLKNNAIKIKAMNMSKNINENNRQEIICEIRKLDKELKGSFNPNSPKQLKTILFDIYGIDESQFTDKGKVTTQGEYLERYYCKTKHEFIGALIEYRDYISTLKGLNDIIMHSTDTGFYNKAGHKLVGCKPKWGNTVSSRFTTSTPNIQGLKRSLKKLNSAKKGYKVLSIDIRQQEAVIYFSTVVKEPHVVEALKRDSKDYYMTIAKFCTARDCLLEVLAKYCREYNYDIENILQANNTHLLKKVTNKSLDNDQVTLEHKNGRFNLKFSPNSNALYDYTNKILILAHGLNQNNPELTERINRKLKEWNDVVLEEAIYKYLNTEIDSTRRDLFKLAIIMTMYGASLSSVTIKVGEEVAESLFDMIRSSDAYKETDKYAKAAIRSGNLTIHSAFGTASNIENKGYGYKHRCFFNRPTQTTGADLISFTLNSFEKWRKENNLTDNEVALTYSVYDEVNIHIREDLLNLVPQIKAFTEFKVEDWPLLYSEVAIGDYNNG